MTNPDMDEIRIITYSCPVCKEKREVMINRLVHLKNPQLQSKGVVNYYDIHFSSMYGIHACKLVIDTSLTLRGYYAVESLLPKKTKSGIPMVVVPYNHQVIDLGQGLLWKHWKEVVITFAMEKRIVRITSHDGETNLIPMVEEDEKNDFIDSGMKCPSDISIDRVVSTALTISIDWACDTEYSENLYFWFKELANILQTTDNVSNERIIELLQFIDSQAENELTDTGRDILQYLTFFNSLLILFNENIQEKGFEEIKELIPVNYHESFSIFQNGSSVQKVLWESNELKEVIGGTKLDIVNFIMNLENNGVITVLIPEVIATR